MPRTARSAAPARNKTPRINIDKPSAAQRRQADDAYEAGKTLARESRREENRARFLRVIYGGGGGMDGRKRSAGRLPKLRQAFENLAQAANTDHYEFTHSQAVAVLSVVEAEVHKLRQVFETNAKPG